MKDYYNFRDLGGIKAQDGRVIKKGLLFRSGMLDELDNNDLDYIKSLKIKIAYDYREKDEVGTEYPYEYANIRHVNYPATYTNQKLFKLKNASKLVQAFSKVDIEDIKLTYKALPFDSEGYRQMVSSLINHEVPLLQHCAAGKDRAGIGIVIILLILGVSKENILEDYMKSTVTREHNAERLGGKIPKFIRNIVIKNYEPLITVIPELLESAFDEIYARYQSIDNYLYKEFDLDVKTITALRDFYLE